MSCPGCTQNNGTTVILGYSSILNTSCQCQDCDPATVQGTSCIYYGGPNLNCSGIETCDSLDTILSKLDAQICAVSGDYSLYNVGCLGVPALITTEQQFVETISDYVCTLRTDLDTFTDTTYVADATAIDVRFDSLEVPAITCVSADVTPVDTINTVLEKFCVKFTAIDTYNSFSLVNWGQCFVVGSAPTNLQEAFDLVIDQICAVKSTADSGGTALPTFNNVGSCLATPTTTDSLVDTVNKIKTKLCTLPTFTVSGFTWGCVTAGADLQATIQNTVTKLSTVSSNTIQSVSSDFTLVPIDGGDACQGYRLEFAGSIIDRNFALNIGDATPGTFLTKVVAGSNVTFDLVSQPGKVVIDTAGGAAEDTKTKVSATDATSDYLGAKIEGSVSGDGVTVTANVNGTDDKVTIGAAVDFPTFALRLLEEIQTNTTLRDIFCEIVRSCPSPCNTPTNVTVLYSTTSTTTTVLP